MQATGVALFIAASAGLPLFFWKGSSAVDPLLGAASAVLDSGLPVADCPDCVCAPEPEAILKVCSPCAADGAFCYRTPVVGAIGAAVGAAAGHVIRYGRQDRAGAEAGAEIGDPIPW